MDNKRAPATTMEGSPTTSSGRGLFALAAIVLRRAIGRTIWLLWPRVPYRVARTWIERRVRRALADPARIADAHQQMEHLLGMTGRSTEVDACARAYVEHWVRCDSLHWNPSTITRQRVQGSEHLEAAHRLGKGVLLSFVHHAHYAGVFASAARASGVPVYVVAADYEAPGPNFIQHLRVVGSGGGLVSASGGTSGMRAELQGGRVVASAIDVPGGSAASFAGREVRCSSGAVHAAIGADAPIVVLTSHRDQDGVFIRLSAPLNPKDFADHKALLAELVRRHEEAVLAWPEVTYLPKACWQPI